jgi:phosphopantetheinyl transferase (holo-ACP synthase)
VPAIRFTEVEVLIGANGAPRINPAGAARKALGGSLTALSLSHEQDIAVAVVIMSPAIKSREV